ncbi:flippase-like domain-containing protein, partial [Candidatus Woesearchaeota archaeon]|nr:flippase-like domain-containing protein [Candidatus Woesearchaeota archaeon]
ILVILTPIKWIYIIKKQGINLDFWKATKYYFISVFYSFITPARTGSLMRAYYVSKYTKKNLVYCASSIVLERFIDLLVVFLLAIAGAFLLTGFLQYVLIAFALFLIAGLIMFNKDRMYHVFKIFHWFFVNDGLKDKLKGGFDEFYKSLPKLKYWVIPFFLTIAFWLSNYSIDFLVAKAFNMNIPWFDFVMIFPIATILGLIPITVSGLGTREVALIYLFGLYGVKPEITVAFAVVTIVLTSVWPALVGAVLALKESRNTY